MGEPVPLGRDDDESVQDDEYWATLLKRPPHEVGDPFDAGSEAQALRLAELGVLEDWELAWFTPNADEAHPRVGTGGEQCGPGYFPDREAVRLWAAIETAMA